MKAMVLHEVCEVAIEGRSPLTNLALTSAPLQLEEHSTPIPGPGDILLKVQACGVCRTELDQIEGRITPPRLPVVPGHQPVGVVAALGAQVSQFKVGDRAGVTWLYSSCGQCKFCRRGEENLCDRFLGTGCHADGGYAEYMIVPADFAIRIPPEFTDPVKAAPLMCSGAVGYRSLKLSGMEDGKTLGLYGFGSAHHLVLQMARFAYPGSQLFVLARNPLERELAQRLGADWTGDIEDRTPEKLDCAIDATPAWKPVVQALENLEKGGRLVLNLIRKESADRDYLQKLDYVQHLWLEKEIKTVANVTRKDAEEALALAAKARLQPEVQEFKLEEANKALIEVKSGRIRGSKVLVM